MFKKELIKIAISALVGFVIGLIYAFSYDDWNALYLLPLYAIGFVYSYQYLFNILSALFRWFAGVVGFSIGSSNCCGFVIAIGIFLLLIYVVMSYVWIAGLVLAVWALFQAFQQDGMITSFRLPFRSSRSKPEDDNGWGDDNSWGSGSSDSGSAGNSPRWDDDDDSW